MIARPNPLVGTWKLVSSTRRDVESGEEVQTFGPQPTGFLSYSPGGRMMVVVVGDDRREASGPVPSDAEKLAWFNGALAYAGRYTLDGGEVTHHVEASLNPLRPGGRLVRSVRLDGSVLTLTAPPAPYSAEGRIGVVTIVWKRIE